MIGAFEGIDGAHSQLVLDAYFRARDIVGQTLGSANFREIAMAVAGGRAELGVVPIDNTTIGTIQDAYDLLFEFDLVPGFKTRPPPNGQGYHQRLLSVDGDCHVYRYA